ncbi:MAG: hypothetical protein H6839_14110 [Planctomycetes bacterium]|nr:hypothetical protein [Planctomycetota bacterium]
MDQETSGVEAARSEHQFKSEHFPRRQRHASGRGQRQGHKYGFTGEFSDETLDRKFRRGLCAGSGIWSPPM